MCLCVQCVMLLGFSVQDWLLKSQSPDEYVPLIGWPPAKRDTVLAAQQDLCFLCFPWASQGGCSKILGASSPARWQCTPYSTSSQFVRGRCNQQNPACFAMSTGPVRILAECNIRDNHRTYICSWNQGPKAPPNGQT